MILLEPGKFYHIYNRGIDRCNLYYSKSNYQHFLRLYEKYIDPVAETYAWVLLGNHFHLLVRIKEEEEINLNALPVPVDADPATYQKALKKYHLYFSDLFNAYSKAINKQRGRVGSLFQRPFRRIIVDDPGYFRNLIVYIHRNPEHHRFTSDYKDYPWSSYGTILSVSPTTVQRSKVLGWFNGMGEFVSEHEKIQPMDFFDRYIIEEE
jgi:putative transposase